MAIHTLSSNLIIKGDLGRVWSFFSDPRNLATITPKEMGFEVLSALPPEIHGGMMIEYRVRPLAGIALTWLTEITHLEIGRYFVDEQRLGPYALWHHEHHFRDLGNGSVEMKDLVTYVPPWGFLGEMVHPLLIRPALEKIFTFRKKAILGVFGEVL